MPRLVLPHFNIEITCQLHPLDGSGLDCPKEAFIESSLHHDAVRNRVSSTIHLEGRQAFTYSIDLDFFVKATDKILNHVQVTLWVNEQQIESNEYTPSAIKARKGVLESILHPFGCTAGRVQGRVWLQIIPEYHVFSPTEKIDFVFYYHSNQEAGLDPLYPDGLTRNNSQVENASQQEVMIKREASQNTSRRQELESSSTTATAQAIQATEDRLSKTHNLVAKPQEARTIHRSARARSQAPGPEDLARTQTSGQSRMDAKNATLASAIDLDDDDDDDEVVITRLKLGKKVCSTVKIGPVDIDAIDSDIEAIESFSLDQNDEEDHTVGHDTNSPQLGQGARYQQDDTTEAREDVPDDDRSSSETVYGDRAELELGVDTVAATEEMANFQKRLDEARSKRAEVEAENKELEREIAAEEADWEEARLAQALDKNKALKRKRARLSRQLQD